MSIKLKLDGFDELMNEIQKAEGNVQKATEKCMEKSAEVMESTLKAEMQKSNVDSSLVNRMPKYTIENDYGEITARVGYKKGSYDPKNISDGYKVVFINYGTPNKIDKDGEPHIAKRGFIQRAKNKSKSKIKKTQEQTLKEILKGL